MKEHIAIELAKDINLAYSLTRKVGYQPINCELVNIVSIAGYSCVLDTGITINLLDENVNRDSFSFSAELPLTDSQKRKQLLEGEKKTWLEAKTNKDLFMSCPALTPVDNMFNDDGYLYPTKCYSLERTQKTASYLPIKYDIDYVLDFYQQRVIKQLSLDNQLTLLRAINALYSGDNNKVNEDEPSLDEQFKAMPHNEQLELIKELVKPLGKRLIALR